MQVRLTAALVRRLTEQEPPARDRTYFDLELRRFALRVKPPSIAGQPWSSTYFVRYTSPEGHERRTKVANAQTVSLDQARKAGRLLLGKIDQGRDPAAERAAIRSAWTVADAAEAFLGSPDFTKRAPHVQALDRACLELHVVHRLGREKLADIDLPMVRRLLREVENDDRINTRKRRLGGPGAARKVVRRLSALLTWAVGEGRLERNPIIGHLRLDGDGMRETVLSTPEAYATLFATMDGMVAAYQRERAALVSDPAARAAKFTPGIERHAPRTLRPAARAFIVVAAATGMRRGELQSLTWEQVDIAERRITLPTSKGAKLARRGPKTETVSLPPLAAAALAVIRPASPEAGEQVFVPTSGTKLSINREWAAVREAAGLPADLTLHGLRHSVGTIGILSGLSTVEVKRMLRHRSVATTDRYVHLADRNRLQDRAMAGMLGDADPAPVVRLNARRAAP